MRSLLSGRLYIAMLAMFAMASCSGDRGPTQPTEVRAAFDTRAELVEATATLTLEANDITTLAAKTLTLSGVVSDKAVATWKVANANVTATPGGKSTKTTKQGNYTFKLAPGTYTIKVTAPGYVSASIKKSLASTTALDVKLTPKKPAGATARCKDRTWSFSQNRAGTCSHHKGVQYWVCPGKLCKA